MTLFIPLLLFTFGLIFGSFLNVVILRYDPERSVFALSPLRGRSHCVSCGKTLAWYELIPLFSFLVQLGRCRTCGSRLSWQYPIVELLTGLIFLTPFYFTFLFPLSSVLLNIIWTLVFLIFLVLAAIDYYWYIIPDELNVALAGLGIARIFIENKFGYFGEFSGSFVQNYSALFGLRSNIWLNHLAGGVAGLLLIAVIIWATRGKGMGMGDLKLMTALGILFGWPDILFVLSFGAILGSLYGVILLVSGKKGMKDSVPFGPFLVLGSVALIFFGNVILSWYFSIFI